MKVQFSTTIAKAASANKCAWSCWSGFNSQQPSVKATGANKCAWFRWSGFSVYLGNHRSIHRQIERIGNSAQEVSRHIDESRNQEDLECELG